MIHRLENRETSQPGTMWFARTNHSRWRLPRDVSNLSYHPTPRCSGHPHAAPPRHREGRQPDRSRADRTLRDRLDKRSCAPHAYRTKLHLAEAMLKEVIGLGLRPRYIAFDTHYTAGWFTKLVGRLGLIWVGTLHPRTIVVWRSRRQAVAELAGRLPLKWRKRLEARAAAVSVYAPTYGTLWLVVTRNRHGNHEYIVTNESGADLTSVVKRKM